MASVEQLTIQFSGKGAGKLTGQLNSLSKAMNRLARRQIEVQKETTKTNNDYVKYYRNTDKAGGITSAFGKRLSTARSKLLIYSFAIGLVSKTLVSLVKTSGKQQESLQRLSSAFGKDGVDSLSKYASELQKVSTFGDENINVAMAQFGAFGANVDQTKALAKATLDLSVGMGLDLNNAALLIAKSFASSTNALSRYDIQLDSTMSKQEKIAAITSEVEKKYGGLAKQIAATTTGQLTQAQNAMGDLGEKMGSVLAPAILKIAKGFKFLAESIDIKLMRTLATSVLVLGTGFALIAVQAKLAAAGQVLYQVAIAASSVATVGLTASLHLLKAALVSTGVGALVVAMGALVPLVMNLRGRFDEANYVLDENGNTVRRLTEEEIKLRTAQIEGEKVLSKKLAMLKATTEAEKEAIRQGRELSLTEIKLVEDIKNLNDASKEEERINDLLKSAYNATLEGKIALLEADLLAIEMSRDSIDMTDSEIDAYQALVDKLDELKDKKGEMSDEEKEQIALRDEVIQESMSKATEFAQHQIDMARAVAEAKIEAINRAEQIEIGALRNTWLYKKMTDKQKAAEEKKITDKHEADRAAAKKIANEETKKMFKLQQGVQIAETIMSTQAAVMKTLAKGGGFFSTPLAMVVAAMGAASVAMIASQKPPTMQFGGLVGGNRHSAGGTMIEAERGEYVISRPGVEAAGIEALNRINTGDTGGGGGTSIVINNPILGKDTIEDEIVPQIKEALRRGGDIGI